MHNESGTFDLAIQDILSATLYCYRTNDAGKSVSRLCILRMVEIYQ